MANQADGRVGTLAIAVATGVVAGMTAGFLWGKWSSDKHHALDVVEVLTSANAVPVDSHGNVVHSTRRASLSGVAPPTSVARQVDSETELLTSGDLVAGGASDPLGTRRKLSVEYTRRHAPVIVGVAGASGSGKTSIASLMAERLKDSSVVSISSDSYYKTLPKDVDPLDYNFDHPAAIDFDLMAEHLESLRAGQDVEVPTYDFVHHRRTSTVTRVCGKTTSIIILDGILVLHPERLRNVCDITIFCVEDLDVCLARRLRRDIVERGRTVESVLSQYLRFVKPGFTQWVAPTMQQADFIVPRARENKTAIDMLACDVQRRSTLHVGPAK